MAQQQSNNQSRQPTSYPSPHSYPSPSMSAYAYPPPAQGQATETYRASPTGSNVSLPSLSLPPIRTIDSRPQSEPSPQQQHNQLQQQLQQQQQQQEQNQQQHQQQQQPHQQPQPQQQTQQSSQQQGGQAIMNPGLPLPLNPMGQFYHSQGQALSAPQHINVTSDPTQAVRYPIPPTDGRVMSGGRHKKEIKRRTKTGCLTCRKRRIKCDETHPGCRNCLKSKRECLGYDPIFKSQPGPPAIQPAPTAAPAMHAASATSSPYPAPPQSYMSGAAQPYAPTLSTGVSSPSSSTEPFDYTTAIDPALEGTSAPQVQIPAPSYDGGGDYKHDLENVNSFPQTALPQQNHKAKRTKIEDLFALGGIPAPPPAPPFTIPPATLDEIKKIYSIIYAPALDRFLETRWFQLRGLSYLLHDGRLLAQYATLLSRVGILPSVPHYFQIVAATHSLEASLIWSTMCLCRPVASVSNLPNGQTSALEANDGVHETVKRLEIFENLISCQYMSTEPPTNVDSTRNGTVFDEQLKFREREFWRLVHKFLTIRDDEAGSAEDIEDTLTKCRALLDSRENRDVIYSIAVSRHLGQRMAEFPENLPPPASNDEQDARAKLYVAKKFIEDEAEGKGTNQVIQRLCGMAMRSWTLFR